jgi:glycosyltransferase involved in cell wall biosynthesis
VLLWTRLRYGVDTVWVNGIPDIVALPFARLLGCRTLATRHLTLDIESLSFYRGFKRRMAELFYRSFAFTAHKIVCVSRPVERDLSRFLAAEKLTVISNWQPKIPEPVVPSGSAFAARRPFRLLYVGRLQQYKGAGLILEAMRKRKADGGRTVSLTIVGEGRYRDELEQQAVGLDVTFTGFQSDPAPYYRACDVFVNPTMGPEGMPLVSIEAMSYGLACIFSDLQVHREITDDGTFTLLFRSGDAEDLLSKIELLLGSEALLRQYGQRAREAVLARHTSEVAFAQYAAVLELPSGDRTGLSQGVAGADISAQVAQ